MFVLNDYQGKDTFDDLKELECWAKEKQFSKVILETSYRTTGGDRAVLQMRLDLKTENYGPYVGEQRLYDEGPIAGYVEEFYENVQQ